MEYDEYEEEEEEEEGYDEDEDGDNTMFIRNCKLSEMKNNAEEDKNFLGQVELRIIYDDDVFGARIVASLNESNDVEQENYTVCNHLIAIQTQLEVNGSLCSWSALDFSTDPPSYRNFEALFANEDECQEFKDIFYEGKELADQSEILEKPIYGGDDNPNDLYYGEGGDYENEPKS